MMFQYEGLLEQLSEEGLGHWAEQLRARAAEALTRKAHGHIDQWEKTIAEMPAIETSRVVMDQPAVTFQGEVSEQCKAELRGSLMTLHPWRKGPFDLYGVFIDTEWQSNLKWERVASNVDFRDASVLDIGSGNGYYGWRMLGAGAKRVIGLDPFPIYVAQHHAIHRYAIAQPNYVLIGSDEDILQRLNAFDIVCSMGVLYHRTSPIDHLLSLAQALKPGGQLVVETLVNPSGEVDVLVPKGRYAQMRNVWFLPSPKMLERFLERSGFTDVEIVDITRTTTQEQRQTEWMHFDSLQDFLSPDRAKTIEGYPPPTRALAVARRR